MKKPKVSTRGAPEKTLISVRLDPKLATQVKIIAQTQGGLSKWVGETLLEKIREMRNDPNFMEVLYDDEEE